MRTWLKELRVHKGLTHNEVAEASDVERAYYTMIERGSRNPSVDVAKRIANTLGFDWTFFFEGQCNETKHTNEVS